MQLSLTSIKTPVVNFLHRFHVMIFVIIVLGGLGLGIFTLSDIVNKPPVTETVPTNTSFDNATIDKVKELRTSDQPSVPLDTSRGRVDPFIE